MQLSDNWLLLIWLCILKPCFLVCLFFLFILTSSQLSISVISFQPLYEFWGSSFLKITGVHPTIAYIQRVCQNQKLDNK